jgi:hypothetical protein
MEKVVRVFHNQQEAEAADAEEDLRMTPEQRIDTVLELQRWVYPDASEQGFVRVYRITQLEQS